jgi:hypothetical protein
MKTNPARLALIVSICIILTTFGHAQQTQENYPPGPDSKPQPDVPKGEVLKFTFDQSKIFPGTWREYWVYVPAQYTPDKPACLYVNQDGIQWQAPTVFDNLIHKKEMPVTIGVFVMHGRVKASDDNTALDRFNRSYEYDGLGDNYVRFLTEEHLPEFRRATHTPVAQRKRPRYRRLVERRNLRFHSSVGAPRSVQPRLQRDWHLCGFARRRPLPHAHPQVRAETDSHLSARRFE